MKSSILTICISIFSLVLFAQSPQKADITTKKERTSITQEEQKRVKEKKAALNDQLKTLQEKHKTNPSDEMFEKIEYTKRQIHDLKILEEKPVKKAKETEKPDKSETNN